MNVIPLTVQPKYIHIFSSIRETLLGQLSVNVRQIRDDFVQKTGTSKVPKGKNLPETVNNMVFVRQLEAKVRIRKTEEYRSNSID